ncbi:MAG: 3-deoxy-D-manno-octulosonic acid transferase [Candidatus Eisenbacteria bacterium]|uniref:3-deoxy-D-manno-octulosonic acid transferase n=1 Tax=Eiseniibacteriota bacterium TaxID=2212470 RepID=A0A937X7H5_UNCEI|nr:3-deoxy-D-manno-octulosonic acid transferase [Candidatus Eisenbacteria bacterium]
MRAGLTLYRAAWGGGLAVGAPYLLLRALLRPGEMRERRGDWDPLDPGARGGVWVHAASVGEGRAAAALLGALRDRGARPLLSVTTPAARRLEAQFQAAGALAVRHAPLDIAPFVRRVLRRVEPRALLILETEIWPIQLVEADRARIPVAFVSARLTERSLRRLRPWKGALAERLRQACVAAQSEADAARWSALGIEDSRLRVTGNLKYERPRGPLPERQRLRQRAGWDRVAVFGSVRSGEVEAVAEAIAACRDLAGGILLVVAPRHPGRSAEALRRALAPLAPLRERGSSEGPLLAQAGDPRAGMAVLLLGTVGELRAFYALADAAFVGGTLAPVGGHNLFEAAECAVPVLHGPHCATVADVAAALARSGGGFLVESGAQLGIRLRALLADEPSRAAAARAAHEAALRLGGALEATLAALDAWGVLPGREPWA